VFVLIAAETQELKDHAWTVETGCRNVVKVRSWRTSNSNNGSSTGRRTGVPSFATRPDSKIRRRSLKGGALVCSGSESMKDEVASPAQIGTSDSQQISSMSADQGRLTTSKILLGTHTERHASQAFTCIKYISLDCAVPATCLC
jgi:hypothetical protein